MPHNTSVYPDLVRHLCVARDLENAPRHKRLPRSFADVYDTHGREIGDKWETNGRFTGDKWQKNEMGNKRETNETNVSTSRVSQKEITKGKRETNGEREREREKWETNEKQMGDK